MGARTKLLDEGLYRYLKLTCIVHDECTDHSSRCGYSLALLSTDIEIEACFGKQLFTGNLARRGQYRAVSSQGYHMYLADSIRLIFWNEVEDRCNLLAYVAL